MLRDKKIIKIALLLALIVLAGLAYFRPAGKDPEVHIHAGLHVYIDGEQQDYSGFEFMSIEPCGEEEEDEHSDSVNDNIHLHDGIGNVVHIHTDGVSWRHVLEKLGLDTSNLSEFYLDNEKVDISTTLNQEVKDLASALVIVGNDPIEITPDKFVDREFILETAEKGESCTN
jgi:hypothetical protein